MQSVQAQEFRCKHTGARDQLCLWRRSEKYAGCLSVMKAPKAATGPTAAGTCTYVSYQQGHWGQLQGLTGMCDIWHKRKRIGKSANIIWADKDSKQ